jgi:glucose-6-phosphate isomerase
MKPIIETQAWKTLQAHKLDIANIHVRDLFTNDPGRFQRFSIKAENFLLDFSKNRFTQTTYQLLLELAEQAELSQHINDLFSGKKINTTEKRAALHTALRNPPNTQVVLDGTDIMPEIHRVLDKMRLLSNRIRQGDWRGFSGKAITDIVNIGIGGSDLGPKMVVHALKNFSADHLTAHFVSNIDGTAIRRTLARCNPETTLFIIASKSFSTIETLANAQAAKAWLSEHTTSISQHFIAIANNTERAVQWGIETDHILPLWDWVGGRYSLWSAIGLSIAIMLGMDHFDQLLAGAHSLDQHFQHAPFDQNLPMLLGLIGVWNHNFLHMPSNAILPYCEALQHFSAHLQQLEMESNGKVIDYNSRRITEYQTGPIIWGDVGANGQHSFHQLLHQGTAKVWCDFILPIKAPDAIGSQHDLLVANCLAQSQALMLGKTQEQAYEELKKQGLNHNAAAILAPHRCVPGNRASTTLLIPELSPFTLGQLVALYEHKVFVMAMIWQINPFDQWGVELGKQLTHTILDDLSTDRVNSVHDCSTTGLLDYFKQQR